MKRMILTLSLIAFSLPISAQMYKWKIKNQVFFGDVPPYGVIAEPVLLRGQVAKKPVTKPQASQEAQVDPASGELGAPPVNKTENTADALIAKRKADEEARLVARKVCNDANILTSQLLATPPNKRPLDYDEKINQAKKEAARVCR